MHIAAAKRASGAQTFCDILAKAFLLFSNSNQELRERRPRCKYSVTLISARFLKTAKDMNVAVPRILLLARGKQIAWTIVGLQKTLRSSTIMIDTRGSTITVVASLYNSRMVVSSMYE
jgi:hypothetical protein